MVPPGDGNAHWYSAEVEVQLTVEVQIYPQDNLVTTISFLTAILHRLQASLGHSDAQNNNAAKSDVGVPPRALCPFPGLRLPVYPSHRCSYQYITVPQPVSAHLQNPTAENRENMGPGSWHRSCQSPDSPDSAQSPSLGGSIQGVQILNFFLLFYPPCRLLAVDKQLNTKLGGRLLCLSCHNCQVFCFQIYPLLLSPKATLCPTPHGFWIPDTSFTLFVFGF